VVKGNFPGFIGRTGIDYDNAVSDSTDTTQACIKITFFVADDKARREPNNA